MSRRKLTGLLFAIFFVLLPVPFVMMGGVAWAPLLRLFALATLMGVLAVVDGVHGLMGIALAMVFVQTVVLAVAVWFLSKICLHVSFSVGGDRAVASLVVGLALVLIVASFFPIYTTPTSSTGSSSNVFEILD